MKIIYVLSIFLLAVSVTNSFVFADNNKSAPVERTEASTGLDHLDSQLFNRCQEMAATLGAPRKRDASSMLVSATRAYVAINAKIPQRIYDVHTTWLRCVFWYQLMYFFLIAVSVIFGTIAASNITKDGKWPLKSIFITIATISTGLNASFSPELYWRKYEEASVILHLAIASYEVDSKSDVCPVIFAAYDGEKLIHAK